MTIHAALFWLIAGSGLVVGCVDGWLGADVFMLQRGVRPGRLSRPLAGLLGGVYLFAVCATLMAILGCPYPLAVDTYSSAPGLVRIVAASPVVVFVLALAARLRPVIAGLGRGEPALVVVDKRACLRAYTHRQAGAAEPVQVHEVATEPDERPFVEPTHTVHEVADEPKAEPEAPRFTFDRGDLADEWAAIDRRLRRAAA